MVDTNSLHYFARRVEKSILWFETYRPLVVVPWVVLLELRRQVSMNRIVPDAYLRAKRFARYYPSDMKRFTQNTEDYLAGLVPKQDGFLDIPDLLVLRSAVELGASLCTNDSKLFKAAERLKLNLYRCDWVVDLNAGK